MDDLGVGFGAIHVHGQQQHQVERHSDDAVTLFALIFDVVVFAGDVARIAEDFLRRLERNSMEPKVLLSLRGVPCESHFHISRLYIHFVIRKPSRLGKAAGIGRIPATREQSSVPEKLGKVALKHREKALLNSGNSPIWIPLKDPREGQLSAEVGVRRADPEGPGRKFVPRLTSPRRLNLQ